MRYGRPSVPAEPTERVLWSIRPECLTRPRMQMQMQMQMQMRMRMRMGGGRGGKPWLKRTHPGAGRQASWWHANRERMGRVGVTVGERRQSGEDASYEVESLPSYPSSRRREARRTSDEHPTSNEARPSTDEATIANADMCSSLLRILPGGVVIVASLARLAPGTCDYAGRTCLASGRLTA